MTVQDILDRSDDRLLRFALVADALASGVMGVALAAAAGPLAGWLGLPEALLRLAGLALLPWSAVVARVATRASLRRGAVKAIIAVNAVWVAASLLVLALTGPTGLGVAFVLAQALAVAGLAAAQWIALRLDADADLA